MTFANDRLHHLAGALTHMASRLSDHIERLDRGNVAAIDDLAVTLRSLVGSGKGNAVLPTACRVFNIDQPTLQCSRPPVRSGAHLSIGSLPVEEAGAKGHGAREVKLSKWISEPVLRCATKSGAVSYSWDKLVREYANKWGGAHLDSQVPDELYMIERHAAAGLVMSTYLLRTAGVAVWGMTQSVLGKVLRPDVEAGDVGIFSSPGSESPKPEYRKQFGQLQWLTLSPDNMDFGWYVDHFSQENTLRLSFGAIPYDIRYEPEGVGQGAVPGRQTPQGPRHETLEPKVVVDPSRKGTVTGVMVPIQQLREAVLTSDSGPASTVASSG